MKQINLYQAAFHPPRPILPARKLLAGGAVFLGGLLALYAWDAWRLASLRQAVGQLAERAANLEARVNSVGVGRQADPQVLAATAALESRLRNLQLAQDALASGALGAETGYAAQFRALARAQASGAWLTRVEIGERGHEMNLHGRALSGEDSARLIASLRREPLFVGLSFAALALTPPADKSPAADAVAGKPAPPPRFLEFVLMARQPDEAAALGRADKGPAPQPPTVTLPELLAKQAANVENAP